MDQAEKNDMKEEIKLTPIGIVHLFLTAVACWVFSGLLLVYTITLEIKLDALQEELKTLTDANTVATAQVYNWDVNDWTINGQRQTRKPNR